MSEDGEDPENLPETITDLLGSLDGIPVPVKRSFFRALGSLITGVADVPSAWLEGQAARIRTRTNGHQLVMGAAAKAAADLAASDPSLVDRALKYHANQLVREQTNRESVAYQACDALNHHSREGHLAEEKEVDDREVDDEWLLQFGEIASRKSKEDVQIILGRILAGEVVKPGSFAPVTLEVLARLDRDTAQWFERICGWAFVDPPHWPSVVLDSLGVDGDRSLNTDIFLHLQNYGLMSSVRQKNIKIEYYHECKLLLGGQSMVTSKCARVVKNKFIVSPYVAEFSLAGAQLLDVVHPTFDREYARSLRDGLARWGVAVSFPELIPALEEDGDVSS